MAKKHLFLPIGVEKHSTKWTIYLEVTVTNCKKPPIALSQTLQAIKHHLQEECAKIPIKSMW